MIELRLKKAFTEEIFEKLKKVKWTRESVDVNNIKRVVVYMGRGFVQTAKPSFVIGFPDSILVALQQLPDVEEKMEITEMLVGWV